MREIKFRIRRNDIEDSEIMYVLGFQEIADWRDMADCLENCGQSTGLPDKNGAEIYEGDILSDYTETDEGIIKSFQQVYWCEKKGAWMLDESYHQNKSEGRLLCKNLEQFDYEISGNIYENPELIKK